MTEESKLDHGHDRFTETPIPGAMGADSLSVIVIGASGDLAKKKTFPALFELYCAGLLPSNTIIYGYARSAKPLDVFHGTLDSFLKKKGTDAQREAFLQLIHYHQGQYDSAEDFASLAAELSEVEAKTTSTGVSNRLFYFAIPPKVFVMSAASIKASALTDKGWNRVVVEKPFGRDAESSKALSVDLAKHLEEHQIFRIDHYLGKEMVQNLLITRFANAIFEPIWNRHHVNVVQITFKEPFGTEGRGGYFNDIGLIRDVMQNHLLQVLSLVAMEPPVSLRPEDIRDEKVKVLRCISELTLDDLVIGQYGPNAQGTAPGYLDDPGVPKDSVTPTFATAVLHIKNPRWHGVPFILKCGKALNERKAEIRLQFKSPPNELFRGTAPVHNNELVFRIQPNEAVWVRMNSKLPGLSSSPVETELDLSYKTRFPTLPPPEAYARLLLDVLRGDHAQFVRDDELEAAWAIFSPVLHELEEKKVAPYVYPYGSRGPPASDDLVAKYGFKYDFRYASAWRRKTASESYARFKESLTLDKSRLMALLNDFMLEMDRGLAGEESSMKMIPSYVTQLPTGEEAGDYFAIDLGGSNLRVVSFRLNGDGTTEPPVELKRTIPDEVMKGSSEGLFGFIADLVKEADPPKGAKFGFTFSFPCDQTALDAGKLITWTKGFESPGVVGRDVVALLKTALEDRGVDVDVVALVNDTVGTLMAKAYFDKRARIGVILGTGTNGAYVERTASIPKWHGPRDGIMIVNMEWGGFGSGAMGRSLLPITAIDAQMDSLSPNPTAQRYEKMISGMYLGELHRLAMLELSALAVVMWGKEGTIPADSILRQPWKFGTAYMSAIAADATPDLSETADLLRSKAGVDTSLEDRKIIQEVAELLARRAARITAVGIAGCVNKMAADGDGCVVGIDGSVFLKYPKFADWLRDAVGQLGIACSIVPSTDGSGLGAAVIAAVSSKL